ncbi:MAG: LysM peptidoglycan-binding domain-containing protein [Chitinophagaceae bacterium]|nr:LysM peptidoglycan-binding domain-containing protein [Chitinophagaceae bacterium]
MKRILILLFLVPFVVSAQNKPLIIEGTAPNLYLTHTVASKENYYSVGRMYNISPKEIAPFNKMELEKGLSLGQVIKVPLSAVNFSQDAAVAADEVLVPVYHIVKEKEGLYRIATNYNKLPVETLKQWNNIKDESVNNGTKLIVGYLKVKKELSSLSGMAKPVAPATAGTVPAKDNAPKTIPVKETPKPEVSNETLPVVKKPEVKPVVVKKEDKPVAEPTPVKRDPPAVVKQEEKTEMGDDVPKAKNFKGGFFKSMYNDQSRGADIANETGTAAIFKSTSGWEDGKYYCLHNAAAPGTIIKITNPATGRSVYAKVLDAMPDIKQNTGVLIRISNAASAELGLDENKFDCTLSYSK